MSKNLLIIFTKNPVRGKVKTRLAATIGEDKALEIYQLLLKRTHKVSSKLSCAKWVFYTDTIPENDVWQEGFDKKLQSGNDLGEKMANALKTGFISGFDKICLIGSDCYQLDEQILEEAFESLRDNDVVLGPSLDGGYYLVGSTRLHNELFLNKTWSTETVFEEAISTAKQLNLRVKTLTPLSDIDVEDDLKTIPSWGSGD